MKNSAILASALFFVWLIWSGHYDKPFIIGLGIASCAISIWISSRMHIVDEEGAPAQLGIRPFYQYAPWLAKEIAFSNWQVAKIILSPKMPMRRNMVTITAHPESELGRVMLANSITLTPGTVAVSMEDDEIVVHALTFEGSAEDISSEMDRRIQALEKSS